MSKKEKVAVEEKEYPFPTKLEKPEGMREVILYYDNAGTRIKSQSFYNPEGKLEGTQFTWTKEGKPETEKHYKNGRLHGKSRYWNDDGVLMSETEYSNGKLHGNETSYYHTGSVRKVIPHQNGKIHGSVVSYHENGEVKSQTYFIEGVENGERVEYYENKKISSVETIKDGYRTGPYKSFFESGNKFREGEYLKNNEVGSWVDYYESGQIQKTRTKDSKGNYIGTSKDFYESGKIKAETIRNEQGHSVASKEYYETGMIKEEHLGFWDKGFNNPREIKEYDVDGTLSRWTKINSRGSKQFYGEDGKELPEPFEEKEREGIRGGGHCFSPFGMMGCWDCGHSVRERGRIPKKEKGITPNEDAVIELIIKASSENNKTAIKFLAKQLVEGGVSLPQPTPETTK